MWQQLKPESSFWDGSKKIKIKIKHGMGDILNCKWDTIRWGCCQKKSSGKAEKLNRGIYVYSTR